MKKRAILFDSTLCIGCKQCEQACAERNHNPYDDSIAAENFQSAHKFTVVLQKQDSDIFMRRLCMNCLDPTCVSVCPVGALHKNAIGPVSYFEDRCIGCRYCVQACPFGVPKYEWSSTNPRVRKCTMCDDRVLAGRPTACAEACPTGATKFGDRDELLAEAHQRIRENPGKYLDHVYGETEVGGTSILILSSVPFEEFGYRTDLLNSPLPQLTYQVLSKIPDFVSLGAVMLGGVWWITHRRDEVAAAEIVAAPSAESRPAGKGD